MVNLTHIYSGQKWHDCAGPVMPNLVLLNKEIDNYDTFILHGETRSGVTYSILEFIRQLLITNNGLNVCIVGKSFPWLKSAVMRDFFDIMDASGLSKGAYFNKTNSTYTNSGNTVRFMSTEVMEAFAGFKPDYWYIAKAECISSEDLTSLMRRNRGKLLLEYTDKGEVELDLPDAAYIHTTFNDNPFLSERQKMEMGWVVSRALIL